MFLKKLALKNKCENGSLLLIDSLVTQLSVLRNRIYNSSLQVQLSLVVKDEGQISPWILGKLKPSTYVFNAEYFNRVIDNQNDDTL